MIELKSGQNANIYATNGSELSGASGDEDSSVINEDFSENLSDSGEFNDDTEDECTDNENNQLDAIEELRQLALMNPPIPHTRLEGLLNILKKYNYPDLPKSAKTFLGTGTNCYEIEKLDESDPGEFIYFGIKNNISKCINPDIHEVDDIQLIINADGLPLFKSSSKQFWPILCKIFHYPDVYKPFPIAVYCGNQKPNNVNSYLKKIVTEMNELQESGFQINNRIFTISIKAFICDRPARAFMKCHHIKVMVGITHASAVKCKERE